MSDWWKESQSPASTQDVLTKESLWSADNEKHDASATAQYIFTRYGCSYHERLWVCAEDAGRCSRSGDCANASTSLEHVERRFVVGVHNSTGRHGPQNLRKHVD